MKLMCTKPREYFTCVSEKTHKGEEPLDEYLVSIFRCIFVTEESKIERDLPAAHERMLHTGHTSPLKRRSGWIRIMSQPCAISGHCCTIQESFKRARLCT